MIKFTKVRRREGVGIPKQSSFCLANDSLINKKTTKRVYVETVVNTKPKSKPYLPSHAQTQTPPPLLATNLRNSRLLSEHPLQTRAEVLAAAAEIDIGVLPETVSILDGALILSALPLVVTE
jgi:hypothetical protein